MLVHIILTDLIIPIISGKPSDSTIYRGFLDQLIDYKSFQEGLCPKDFVKRSQYSWVTARLVVQASFGWELFSRERSRDQANQTQHDNVIASYLCILKRIKRN
jgi:hypothetical protein